MDRLGRSANALDLPILALGDPWHDSTYTVVDAEGLRHVEVERYTRCKYEDLNSLVAAWMLDRDVVETARVFLFEEGRFFAPLMRKIAAGAKIDFDACVRRMIKVQHGSLSTRDILATPGLVESLVRVFERLRGGAASWQVMDHHFLHASNAFLSSDLERAIAFTLDGGGPSFLRGRQVQVHGSVYRFDRSKPLSREPLQLVEGWSPGWAWVRMAKIFGFGMNDAGTVMAMAAYGQSSPRVRELVRHKRLWEIAEGSLPRWRHAALVMHRRKIAAMAADELRRFDLARALQDETEARIRDFLAPYLEAETAVDICLAGGVFLNCIAAGKIAEWFPQVRRIFIPPAPYDGGLSIGLAQVYLHDRGIDPLQPGQRRAPFATGRGATRADVDAACKSAGLATPAKVDIACIIEALHEGQIIGLFQGSSESGRRALGNRSIIADPRNAATKDLLNRIVKRRQWFRPFAPMILHEEVANWFEVPAGFESPYMSFAVRFRPDKGALVPAVRHEDGTARVQTVHSELTPGTHRLLKAWHAATGVPILLNTSFNDSEPIVDTPHQALATMLRSGIDGIYFADFDLFAANPGADAVRKSREQTAPNGCKSTGRTTTPLPAAAARGMNQRVPEHP